MLAVSNMNLFYQVEPAPLLSNTSLPVSKTQFNRFKVIEKSMKTNVMKQDTLSEFNSSHALHETICETLSTFMVCEFCKIHFKHMVENNPYNDDAFEKSILAASNSTNPEVLEFLKRPSVKLVLWLWHIQNLSDMRFHLIEATTDMLRKLNNPGSLEELNRQLERIIDDVGFAYFRQSKRFLPPELCKTCYDQDSAKRNVIPKDIFLKFFTYRNQIYNTTRELDSEIDNLIEKINGYRSLNVVSFINSYYWKPIWNERNLTLIWDQKQRIFSAKAPQPTEIRKLTKETVIPYDDDDDDKNNASNQKAPTSPTSRVDRKLISILIVVKQIQHIGSCIKKWFHF